MILPKFEYRKAHTVEEALALYNFYDGRAVYLAGGTDLVPRLKLRLQKPVAVIDLKGIEELRGLTEEREWVRVGSLMSLYDLKEAEPVREFYPTLREALDATSCETLQMRGTVGGNILQEARCLFYNQSEFWRRAKGFCLKMGGERCNATGGSECLANYMGDLAPALLSLGAKVRLVGPEGERELGLEGLFTGRGERPLGVKPSEVLTEVLIPKVKVKGGYEKLRLRGAIDYPLVGVALSLWDGRGRLSVGAIGPRPSLKEFAAEEVQGAVEGASEGLRAVANTVLDPLYRRQMAVVLSRRLVKRVLEVG